MIFVTVGTHEQPFDRLLVEVDKLIETEKIKEEVYMQTGFSTYIPKFCTFSPLIPFDKFMELINKARIIITHGGPGSIMPVLYQNKVPIVVPRQKKFREHVDDHQVTFCRHLEFKGKILAVYEIKELEQKIINYDSLITKMKSNFYHLYNKQHLHAIINNIEININKLFSPKSSHL
jgi:UDP-N-acetylglucosamine transferase subunit ALG13